MLSHLLQTVAARQPNQLFLADGETQVTYAEALAWVLSVSRHLEVSSAQRLYFYAPDSVRLIIALMAANWLGLETCVLNYGDDVAQVANLIAKHGPGRLVTARPQPGRPALAGQSLQEMTERSSAPALPLAPQADSNIVILTTGTTGLPKASLYTWQRLISQGRRVAAGENSRWLLAYPLNHFAGIQLLVHVLVNQGSLVIPASRQFEAVFEAMQRHRITAVSATPTFWRLFSGKLTPAQAGVLPVRQITLGGEPATADLLDRLREQFPTALISQVYATTELGSCFSINDGLPGFPASFLNRPVGNVELKIIDDELYVKSKNQMLGYWINQQLCPPANWVASGDLVELVGERVFFRGRKNESINVGGVKVFPLTVESEILKVAGVRTVRVYGKQNPVTGQIVAAQVEPEDGIDPTGLVESIRASCRTRLNRYEQPRDIELVTALERRNEKIVRVN